MKNSLFNIRIKNAMCMMKKHFIQLLIVFGFVTISWSNEDVQVDLGPWKTHGLWEWGQIKKGIALKDAHDIELLEDEWVDRFGGFISRDVIVDNKLLIQVGMGGVFKIPKPEVAGASFTATQKRIPFIGPSIAKTEYRFGDFESPIASLSVGLFPYKYNPDATNLGEYLFRSIAYPSVLSTGGLTAIDGASAYLQGVHLNVSPLENLSLDLLLTTETSLPPYHGLSLAGVFSWSFLNDGVELGGGFNLRHLWSPYEERIEPELFTNSYFDVTYEELGLSGTESVTITGNKTYYESFKQYFDNFSGDSTKTLSASDSNRNTVNEAIISYLSQDSDSLYTHIKENKNVQYYSNQALMLMGRVAVDVPKLLDWESPLLGKSGLRFFAEAAVLGWENHPLFYEKRKDRTPIMFGMNVPTLGLLDVISVQAEYFSSPHLNNHFFLSSDNQPQPFFSGDVTYSENSYLDVPKEDNWSWSVLLEKKLGSVVSIKAQASKDHYRSMHLDWAYGSRGQPNSNLFRKDNWHWYLQLSWGI